MKKFINVKTSFIGYHQWINAPEEVGFLKTEHRHVFNVEIEFEVNHNDRDLEFFIMQKKLNEAIRMLFEKHQVYLDGYKVGSCELVSQELLEYFDPEYSINKISVDEDGENGSILYANM